MKSGSVLHIADAGVSGDVEERLPAGRAAANVAAIGAVILGLSGASGKRQKAG
jgi:hypothetical protein